MLLGEPPRTPFDLNFKLLGYHVRVTPFFWVLAAIVGAGWSGEPVLMLLWIAAVFLSILIHELGHALAFRRYGVESHVVLYHFGGLAIPHGSVYGQARRLDSWGQIFVSFAGPAAQLLLAVLVFAVVRAVGHSVFFDFSWLLPNALLVNSEVLRDGVAWLNYWVSGIGVSPPPGNRQLNYFVLFLLLPSIYWALLNLLPIYPLDGGQISRELFLMRNAHEGIRNSLILSVVTAAVIAVYGFMRQDMWLGIMFSLLGFSSFQMLQAYGGFGGGRGGQW